ncbi:phosphatidylglycerophosphatase A family protein [Thermodesulfovibrio yellowstonii]|uniref:Phosphatidylglycerophosphatase A n=1 Tax=Thermodesulfovibrio yellowstonii TaxID=28262 RepID=A0A9W6GHQ1_9BACT|nr:phosphatidylglycerophosphatase A [Thermodesulfovibrio islandicus]GLI54104.1 phosphatidylglycerophosphatase A [Thermodesulfovibrio islandicus]
MFYKIIATVLFIGYFPFAPGTVCSAVTMIFLDLFKPSYMVVLTILIVSIVAGIIASERIEKASNKKDPSYIVIDEFAGYLTSILFIPINWQNLLIAFILFRIFDIIKPPPIRQIERKLKGGLSIMMDDIIAGLITNVLIRIFLML